MKEKQPLTEILKVLEQRYSIHFSYLDQTVADITAILPLEDLSLENCMSQLQNDTNLEFIIIDDTSIVISHRANPFSEFITQKLEEIIINNYLTKGISKKSDGKISINPERFGILPGLIEPDILQTIQALPGIWSSDETVSNINVRGGTHDQNLILWEGIKMYQSGHFFGMISAFNPYLTKTINISKNGSSVKYGDGVSSVIDMQQSNTLDQAKKYGAGFNMISADAFAKTPLNEKSELQTSVRRSFTDLIATPTYNQYSKRIFHDSDDSKGPYNNKTVTNECFNFYDASLKYLYDITPSDQLRVNFMVISNQLDYDENLKENPLENALHSNLEQNSIATGLSYLKYWNNRITTTAQVSWSGYNLNSTDVNLLSLNSTYLKNTVSDFGIKINATNHIDNNLKLHGGYQFNELIVDNYERQSQPDFTAYSTGANRAHAIYGEAEFTSENKNTYARIGLRTNYIEKFSEFFTEPRLSASHRLNNNFRIEFLGELKSQSISQLIDLKNDFLGIEKRRWALSNEDQIPLIKSAQASLGVHYSQNDLLISLEAFIKDVNGVSSRSQGFQNQYQFSNTVGRYKTKGLDFLIHKQFSEFSTWLSYSYSVNNYNFDGLNNSLDFPSNLDVTHKIHFAGTYNYKSIKLALGTNWHSGKPTTLPSAFQNPEGNIQYDSPNSARLSDYFRADFSTTYNFELSHKVNASFGASVLNILNQKNRINTYYTKDSENNIYQINNTSLGITPNISFRVQF